ncbi:cupin domain-containing protein [Gordonia liuliyuniae]|uniref:Cupin domain-containing protein n=1 Tax=Gordonia liuliyuniae TaxID=2911517 RepID=A0ABS9IN63_9ACTN|nr:cupin domain-containing protein [Gordonia liuliyuniae]MCF8586998.1 cupin domain-containing protein [Gordonia liuliyuniae]
MSSVSLPAVVDELMSEAREASSGRSARTVRGHAEHTLRHTVIALAAGNGLSDHESPGEATLQVLRGTVRLTTADGEWHGTAGDLIDIPNVRHGLMADEDSAVMLTVALRGTTRDGRKPTPDSAHTRR